MGWLKGVALLLFGFVAVFAFMTLQGVLVYYLGPMWYFVVVLVAVSVYGAWILKAMLKDWEG